MKNKSDKKNKLASDDIFRKKLKLNETPVKNNKVVANSTTESNEMIQNTITSHVECKSTKFNSIDLKDDQAKMIKPTEIETCSKRTNSDKMGYIDKGPELLIQAVDTGCLALVKSFVKLNVPVNVVVDKRMPFIEAVCRGFYDIVEFLLISGADVNTVAAKNRNAIHLAVISNNERLVRLLLKYNVPCDVPDRDGHTPLMKAVLNQNLDICALLINNGCEVVSTGDFKETPLSLAAYKGHTEVVKFLLPFVPNTTYRKHELYSALMEASMDGHIELAKLLINAGSPINMQVDGFESPLMLAICSGNNMYVNLLLDNGADVDEVNDDGNTPLMEACREDNEYIVTLLLSRGADGNIYAAPMRESALSIAAASGSQDIVELLVSSGSHVNHTNVDSFTALMEACQAGHVHVAKYLLEHSADPNVKSGNFRTALHFAVDDESLALVKLLVENKADINQYDDSGMNSVIIAANIGNLEILQYLVDNGGEINSCESERGITPLMTAVIAGNLHIVEYLICVEANTMIRSNDNRTLLIEAVKHNHIQVARFLLNINEEGLIEEEKTCELQQEKNENLESVKDDQEQMDAASLIEGCDELIGVNKALLERSPWVYQLAAMKSELNDESDMEEFITQLAKQYEINADFGKNFKLEGIERLNSDSDDVEVKSNPHSTLSLTDVGYLKNKHMDQFNSDDLSEILQDMENFNLINGETVMEEENCIPPNHVPQENDDADCILNHEEFSYYSIHSPREKLQKVNQQINFQQKRQNMLKLQQEKVELQLKIVHEKQRQIQERFDMVSNVGVCKKTDESDEMCIDKTVLSQNQVVQSRDQLIRIREAWLKQLKIVKKVQKDHDIKKKQLLNEAEIIKSHLDKTFYKNCTNGCNCNSDYRDCCKCEKIQVPVIKPPKVELKCTNCSNKISEPIVDVNAQTDSNHDTALTMAASIGNCELVSILINSGADIEHSDKKGFTPLILAAACSNAKVVKLLLDHNANIHAYCEKSRDTSLSLACSGAKSDKARIETINLLLERGADIEHRNVSDYTPLSIAASGGHVEFIKILLKFGAEINSRTGSKLGISPLMLASMNGHSEAVEFLLKNGADVHAQIETNRNTALTLACFQGRETVVKLLLMYNPNIEHRSKTGLTPLMEASSGGFLNVGSLLILNGSDVNALPVISSKENVLTIACEKGHSKFVELLIKYKVILDSKNKKGHSALYISCSGGYYEIVKFLLIAGADPDSCDNRNITCIMVALKNGYLNIVRCLVKYVTQFPIDEHYTRLEASIDSTNDEHLRRFYSCMEVVKMAKNQQESQANKNAYQLVMEEDKALKLAEIKRIAQMKKKEKRKSRKNKMKEAKTVQKVDFQIDESLTEKVDTVEKKKNISESNTCSNESDNIDENGVFCEFKKSFRKHISKNTNTEINSSLVNEHESPVRCEDEEYDDSNNPGFQKKILAKNCIDIKSNSDLGININHNNSVASINNENGVLYNETNEIGKFVYTNGNDKFNKILTEQIPNSRGKDVEMNRNSVGTFPCNIGNVTGVGSISQMENGVHHDVDIARRKREEFMVEKSPDEPTLHLFSQSQTDVKRYQHHMLNNGCPKPNDLYQPINSPESPENINTNFSNRSMILPENGNTDFRRPSPFNRKIKQYPKKNMDYKLPPTSRQNFVQMPRKNVRRDENWKEVPRRNNSSISKKVVVPASAISRVIGRGGCNINAIRESSTAHIDVDKHRGPVDRVITIKGVPECVKIAEILIMALVEDADVDLDKLIYNTKCEAQYQNSFNNSQYQTQNSNQNGKTVTPVNGASKSSLLLNSHVNRSETNRSRQNSGKYIMKGQIKPAEYGYNNQNGQTDKYFNMTQQNGHLDQSSGECFDNELYDYQKNGNCDTFSKKAEPIHNGGYMNKINNSMGVTINEYHDRNSKLNNLGYNNHMSPMCMNETKYFNGIDSHSMDAKTNIQSEHSRPKSSSSLKEYSHNRFNQNGFSSQFITPNDFHESHSNQDNNSNSDVLSSDTFSRLSAEGELTQNHVSNITDITINMGSLNLQKSGNFDNFSRNYKPQPIGTNYLWTNEPRVSHIPEKKIQVQHTPKPIGGERAKSNIFNIKPLEDSKNQIKSNDTHIWGGYSFGNGCSTDNWYPNSMYNNTTCSKVGNVPLSNSSLSSVQRLNKPMPSAFYQLPNGQNSNFNAVNNSHMLNINCNLDGNNVALQPVKTYSMPQNHTNTTAWNWEHQMKRDD